VGALCINKNSTGIYEFLELLEINRDNQKILFGIQESGNILNFLGLRLEAV